MNGRAISNIEIGLQLTYVFAFHSPAHFAPWAAQADTHTDRVIVFDVKE